MKRMKKPPTTVGVRELRTHLSGYMRMVARGQTITIQDSRGRPIARLVPIEPNLVEDHFARLEARGILRRGTGGKPGMRDPIKPRKGAPLLSDLVIEDRR
jgi:prevent-host-death family protein